MTMSAAHPCKHHALQLAPAVNGVPPASCCHGDRQRLSSSRMQFTMCMARSPCSAHVPLRGPQQQCAAQQLIPFATRDYACGCWTWPAGAVTRHRLEAEQHSSPRNVCTCSAVLLKARPRGIKPCSPGSTQCPQAHARHAARAWQGTDPAGSSLSMRGDALTCIMGCSACMPRAHNMNRVLKAAQCMSMT